MELIHRPLSFSGPFRWVTAQRVSVAVAFVAGLSAGFWLGNGHTTQNSIQHISREVGDAENTCQRNRWIAIDAGADPKRLPVCPH